MSGVFKIARYHLGNEASFRALDPKMKKISAASSVVFLKVGRIVSILRNRYAEDRAGPPCQKAREPRAIPIHHKYSMAGH